MPQRFDTQEFKAQITPEGWIRDSPVVTRSGIFEYTRKDGTIFREYRPEEEVFKADALNSLLGVPVTLGHPNHMNSETPATIVGTVLSPGRQDGTNMVADIVIHRPKMLGKARDISLGYKIDIDPTPGTFNGQAYDAVQRNLRMNHAAIVPSGRAGNSRLRLDDDQNQIDDDEERNDSMELVVVRIDGIEYKVPPQVAKAMEKHDAALASANARADSAEAARDTATSETAKAKAEIDKARADAVQVVKARMDLESSATKAGVEFKADASDRDIRVAVIQKVRGAEFKLDGKSEDYVNAAFDLAIGEKMRADSNIAAQTRSATGAEGAKSKALMGAHNARQAMIAGLGRTQ